MGLLGGLLLGGIGRGAVSHASFGGGGVLRNLMNKNHGGSERGSSAPHMSEPAHAEAQQEHPQEQPAEQFQSPGSEPIDNPVVKNPAKPHPMAQEAARQIEAYEGSPVAGLTDQTGSAIGSVPAKQPDEFGGPVLRSPPPKLPRLQVQWMDGNPSKNPQLATYGEAPVNSSYQAAGPGPVPATPFRYSR